jgi:hypothetical protein
MSRFKIHMPRLAGLTLAIAAAAGAYWVHDVRSDTSQGGSRDRASAPSAQSGRSRPIAPPASGAGQRVRFPGTRHRSSGLSNASAPAPTGAPSFQPVAAAGDLSGKPPGPNPAPSPDRGPGPLARGQPNRPGPWPGAPKRPAPVVQKPGPSVPPARVPAPPNPAPIVATPPVAQPPTAAPPATSPPADSAPAATTPDPEASLDDSGLGALDTSALPPPVDETGPTQPPAT